MGATPAAGLLAHLAAAPGEFDFVQAVDILEQAARSRGRPAAPLGRASDPAREAVSLCTPFEFGFRPSPIEEAMSGADGPARLSVNYLALAGSDGPLPEPYVDLIRANLLERETGPADFLALFQHRLLSYGYRAAAEPRCAGPFSEPGEGPLAPALRALVGQSPGGEAGKEEGRAALLLLANLGQAVQMRRSLQGLCMLLGRCFGMGVSGREASGRWIDLPPALRTTVGRAGRNRAVGRGAVLGSRAFQPDGAIDLDFGTLPAALYQALLPADGTRHAELAALCSWYLGPDIECWIKMHCAPTEERCRLGAGARLGQGSWAGAAPAGLSARFVVNASPGAVEDA